MSGCVVFVGPSLPAAAARSVLPAAALRGPAQAGDILRAWRQGFRRIVLIDGVFEQVPAVWHKEILLALEAGVEVIGASSMGALRAAELHPLGMRGVGWVFEQYRDGLEDDDEVALLHADADLDYQPLSVPLINLRCLLAWPRLPAALAAPLQHLIDDLKTLFYPERTVSRISALLADRAVPSSQRQQLLALLNDPGHDGKRNDAVAALRVAAQPIDGTAPRLRPVHRTVFLQGLMEQVGVAEPGSRSRRHAALLAWLADKGIELPAVSGDELQSDLRAWQQRTGLLGRQAVDAFLASRDLNNTDLLRWVARCGALRRAALPASPAPPAALDLIETLL
jgi:hypothetical protein